MYIKKTFNKSSVFKGGGGGGGGVMVSFENTNSPMNEKITKLNGEKIFVKVSLFC